MRRGRARPQILVVPRIKVPNELTWRHVVPVRDGTVALAHPVPVAVHLPSDVACALGTLSTDLGTRLAEVQASVAGEDVGE